MVLRLMVLHLMVLHLMALRLMVLLSFRYFHYQKLPAESHLRLLYRPYLLPQQNHQPAPIDCLPSDHPLPAYPLSARPGARQSDPAVLLSPVPLSADHQKLPVVSHLPFLCPQRLYPRYYLHCPADRRYSPHQLSDLLLFLLKYSLPVPRLPLQVLLRSLRLPLHPMLLSMYHCNRFLLCR